MSTPSATDPFIARELTPEERAHAGYADPQAIPGGTDTIATLQRETSEGSTQERTEATAEGPRLFGGLTPAEAGRRSALRRAERALTGDTEAVHAQADSALVVRVSVATGEIIKRLDRDARGGNVQAARELRAWLAELPIETDTDLSTLDRKTRQAVLARVLSEIEEDDAGLGAESVAHASDSTAGEMPPPQTPGLRSQ